MKINLITIIGVVLLTAGVLALLGVGIPGQETITAVPLSATVDTERVMHPAIAGALVALGLVGVVVGQKKG